MLQDDQHKSQDVPMTGAPEAMAATDEQFGKPAQKRKARNGLFRLPRLRFGGFKLFKKKGKKADPEEAPAAEEKDDTVAPPEMSMEDVPADDAPRQATTAEADMPEDAGQSAPKKAPKSRKAASSDGRPNAMGSWISGVYNSVRWTVEEVLKFIPFGIWTPKSERPDYLFKRLEDKPKANILTRAFKGVVGLVAGVVALPFAALAAPLALIVGGLFGKKFKAPREGTVRDTIGDYRIRQWMVRGGIIGGLVAAAPFVGFALAAGAPIGVALASLQSGVAVEAITSLVGFGAGLGLYAKIQGFWRRGEINPQVKYGFQEVLKQDDSFVPRDTAYAQEITRQLQEAKDNVATAQAALYPGKDTRKGFAKVTGWFKDRMADLNPSKTARKKRANLKAERAEHKLISGVANIARFVSPGFLQHLAGLKVSLKNAKAKRVGKLFSKEQKQALIADIKEAIRDHEATREEAVGYRSVRSMFHRVEEVQNTIPEVEKAIKLAKSQVRKAKGDEKVAAKTRLTSLRALLKTMRHELKTLDKATSEALAMSLHHPAAQHVRSVQGLSESQCAVLDRIMERARHAAKTEVPVVTAVDPIADVRSRENRSMIGWHVERIDQSLQRLELLVRGKDSLSERLEALEKLVTAVSEAKKAGVSAEDFAAFEARMAIQVQQQAQAFLAAQHGGLEPALGQRVLNLVQAGEKMLESMAEKDVQLQRVLEDLRRDIEQMQKLSDPRRADPVVSSAPSDADRVKAEQARQAAEEAEQARQAAEEAERARQAAEETEQARQAAEEEEAEAQRLEQLQAQRARLEAEHQADEQEEGFSEEDDDASEEQLPRAPRTATEAVQHVRDELSAQRQVTTCQQVHGLLIPEGGQVFTRIQRSGDSFNVTLGLAANQDKGVTFTGVRNGNVLEVPGRDPTHYVLYQDKLHRVARVTDTARELRGVKLITALAHADRQEGFSNATFKVEQAAAHASRAQKDLLTRRRAALRLGPTKSRAKDAARVAARQAQQLDRSTQPMGKTTAARGFLRYQQIDAARAEQKHMAAVQQPQRASGASKKNAVRS